MLFASRCHSRDFVDIRDSATLERGRVIGNNLLTVIADYSSALG